MLTQSLNASITAAKVAPVPFAGPTSSVPDRPCRPRGHRVLRTGRTRRSTARMSRPNMSIRSSAARSGPTSCFPTAAARSARFYLPGDVFGLEFGTSHRLAAEAIIDTTVRLVKRQQPRTGGRRRRSGRAQALGHDRRRTPACGRSHAAAGAQERDGARRELPA